MDTVQQAQVCGATMMKQFTFNLKSQGVPGTRSIDLGRMKD